MGWLKLGTLIRFVPVAVVIGFTNGIAVLIAISQIRDFLGLVTGPVPAHFFGMLGVLAGAIDTLNVQALALALACLALIVAWQALMPKICSKRPRFRVLALVPGSVVALLLASVAVAALGLQVDTIGSRFGGIPSSLPGLQWLCWAPSSPCCARTLPTVSSATATTPTRNSWRKESPTSSRHFLAECQPPERSRAPSPMPRAAPPVPSQAWCTPWPCSCASVITSRTLPW